MKKKYLFWLFHSFFSLFFCLALYRNSIIALTLEGLSWKIAEEFAYCFSFALHQPSIRRSFADFCIENVLNPTSNNAANRQV